jgi:antitoxin component of RelBE/YafQ-DinJ toxin-antitoxin module
MEVSPDLQLRLKASAQAEGLPVDVFLRRLIDEHDQLAALVEKTQVQSEHASREAIAAKLERGLLQSDRGEVVDGDTFADRLLNALDEIERKRHVG